MQGRHSVGEYSCKARCNMAICQTGGWKVCTAYYSAGFPGAPLSVQAVTQAGAGHQALGWGQWGLVTVIDPPTVAATASDPTTDPPTATVIYYY